VVEGGSIVELLMNKDPHIAAQESASAAREKQYLVVEKSAQEAVYRTEVWQEAINLEVARKKASTLQSYLNTLITPDTLHTIHPNILILNEALLDFLMNTKEDTHD